MYKSKNDKMAMHSQESTEFEIKHTSIPHSHTHDAIKRWKWKNSSVDKWKVIKCDTTRTFILWRHGFDSRNRSQITTKPRSTRKINEKINMEINTEKSKTMILSTKARKCNRHTRTSTGVDEKL